MIVQKQKYKTEKEAEISCEPMMQAGSDFRRILVLPPAQSWDNYNVR